MKQFISRKVDVNYLRSTIFGLEDALVSTTGVVVGITTGSGDKKLVILASLVTVAVEAISMGAGEYLSEEAVEELKQKGHRQLRLIAGALLMFVSYTVAGLVPIIPIFILPIDYVIYASISVALAGLFLTGYFKGKFVNFNPLRSALEMLVIGGIATLVGVVVGMAFKIY